MDNNCLKDRKQMVGISRQVSKLKEITCNSFTICDEVLAVSAEVMGKRILE